jgi:DNA polymerase III subunit epsilon
MVVSQYPRLTKEERDKQNALLREYGFTWRREGELWRLFDIHSQIVSPESALVSIRSGQIEKPKPAISTANRAAAIEWAYSLTHRSQLARPVIILDTETSGVDMTDMPVQIGIVDLRGNVLIDTLINPDGTAISEKAQETHQISADDLAQAPMFTTIWDQLSALLENCDVLAFNASFDLRLIAQAAHKYGLSMPAVRSHCVMMQYSMYAGELRSQPLRPLEYKMQSLDGACNDFGIVNSGAHRALDDAMATRNVLLAMAALYTE